MSDWLKSLIFSLVMCTVCSVLLTAAATGLQRFQEKNIELDRQKNILKSVGLLSGKKSYPRQAIEGLYTDNINPFWVDVHGEIVKAKNLRDTGMPIYLYVQRDQIHAYILPITSRGLWGKIHGYLAIDSDGATIRGFTVYKHQETPGLGGEIEKSWFQRNFVGKKIINRDGDFVSISIAKGKAAHGVPEPRQINYVDGISGATLTGKFLTEGLKDVLHEYEPMSIRFRSNRVKRIPGKDVP